MLSLLGCGEDEGAEPGTELGPCVQAQYCESALVCAEGVCVDPNQVGAATGSEDTQPGGDDDPPDDGASPGEDDGPVSTTGGDGPVSTTGGDGAQVYCSEDPEVCFCGHSADYGPPGVACSESTVQSPGLCCASEGWPAYGGCSCWTLSCRQVSSSTCVCGVGAPSEDTEPVGSCTTEGGVCCRDGQWCSCHEGLSFCPEDEVEVGSCTVAELACDEASQVSACN